MSWRDLRLGAAASAVAWQVLQLIGGYVVGHLLRHSSALYGVFGVVLGLLAWLYLQAQITLYAMEASTVHVWHLWPRSLFPPPLTEPDRHAYRLYGRVTRRPPADELRYRSASGGPAPLSASLRRLRRRGGCCGSGQRRIDR